MSINHTPLGRRRLIVSLAAAFVVSSGLAVAAQPAVAQNVPPGCGSYSGLPLPVGWSLDDHSNDPAPLVAYQVPAVYGRITIGTQFADEILGNAVDEVICGLGGDDVITSGSGNDEVFGGDGSDSLSGEAGDDFLSGGLRRDTLYGDDGADTLQGGEDSDWLFGGTGFDILRGGPGNTDEGDVQGGGGSCSGIEIEITPC